MMRKIALMLIICSFSQWVHGSYRNNVSESIKGTKLKIHCAALLLKFACDLRNDTAYFYPGEFELFGLFRKESFSRLCQDLFHDRQLFELTHAHPDKNLREIRSIIEAPSKFEYSKKNLVEQKLVALRAINFVKENCTQDEYSEVTKRLHAWWQAESYN